MSDPVAGGVRPLHIVHTESSCGWGGQEIRILTEAEGLRGRGHHLTLVTAGGARIANAGRQKGLTVVELPIARKKISALVAMTSWLARNGKSIDIINTHSSTDSWLAALATRLVCGGPPIVRTRHVSSPVSQNAQTKWLYQKAAQHLVVTGEALRLQLNRDNGFALDSMTSVPTGIDLGRFCPLPIGETKASQRASLGLAPGPVVGILATLRNWKGHTYLFEAFASLAVNFPDWNLLVVGDGPQRANLERLVAQLGIGDRVSFVGNRDDVPEWLRAMDIFVLPSYGDEGVPQSIMQAMACGLPVISTHVGAISEAVLDGRTGLLVQPRNTEMLATTLNKMMTDENLRDEMGRAGIRQADEKFSLGAMLDRMEHIFKQCAQRRGA